MNFLELAGSRYTTKKYDASKKVSAENIQKLKEILRLSPSSINSQPWKFIFISDEKLKNELAEVSYHNTGKINNASHVVVFTVINDVQKFEKRISELLPVAQNEYYKNRIKPLGDEYVKIWMSRQVYITLGYFLAACASMGIDSTPMEGIQKDKYTEILQLNGYETSFAVAIGTRDVEDTNQPSITPKYRFPFDDIIETI